tara:strand:- start:407 stop:1108 length:702 start_codon:yes stop_codon:yes gene_type:complete
MLSAISLSTKPSTKIQKKCQYCSKVFTREDNRRRHLINCKKNHQHQKGIYTQKEVENLVNDMKTEYNKKDIINRTIINELRNQIGLLMQNQGSNITYNTNITLNAFGKEDTTYIDPILIKNLIKTGPMSSIYKLLKHIHFNPDHIENHNILIPNRKSSFAKIFDGEDWQISDKKQTIDHMTDKAYAMINEHYTGDLYHMDNFIEKYNAADAPTNKKIYKDTELMILNNQKLKT